MEKFINTPIVECQWMHIKNPTTNLDANGIYEGELLFNITIPEHKAFLTLLRSYVPTDGKKYPWKKHATLENVYVVKLKQKAKTFANGKSFDFKPKIYDAAAKPLVETPDIPNGSKIAVNIEPRPFTNNGKGLRLNPVAIQIIDLAQESVNEEAGSVANANPFAAQEGSFVQHDPGFTSNKPEQPQQEAPAKQEVPEQMGNVKLDEFDF